MKKTLENLQKSYELSSLQAEDIVNPLEVAVLLENKKLSYVLIGGHMVSFYTGIPRATVDVDFIVGGSDFTEATHVISKSYQAFKQTDRVYHVTYDTKQKVVNPERIDLIKDMFPLFRQIVEKHSITLQDKNYQIRMPTLEAAIALKFAASISPNRSNADRAIDNADLLRLVRSSAKFDEKILSLLGELVYLGGGNELLQVVGDITSGKSIDL